MEEKVICQVCKKPKTAFALMIGWYPVRCDCVKDCPACNGTGLQDKFICVDGVYHKPACKACDAKGVIS